MGKVWSRGCGFLYRKWAWGAGGRGFGSKQGVRARGWGHGAGVWGGVEELSWWEESLGWL